MGLPEYLEGRKNPYEVSKPTQETKVKSYLGPEVVTGPAAAAGIAQYTEASCAGNTLSALAAGKEFGRMESGYMTASVKQGNMFAEAGKKMMGQMGNFVLAEAQRELAGIPDEQIYRPFNKPKSPNVILRPGVAPAKDTEKPLTEGTEVKVNEAVK